MQMQNYNSTLENQGISEKLYFYDSFYIDVPENNVQLISAKLDSPSFTVWETSGEISPSKTKNSRQETINEIHHNISKVVYPNGEVFYRLKISSKFAKEKYFSGLNFETIDTVVETINELNIIIINKDSILNSRFGDLDISLNFFYELEKYRLLLKTIAQNINPIKSNLINSFNRDCKQNKNQNYGLELSTRQNRKVSEPFIKWYYKYNELMQQKRSLPFYQKYLKSTFQNYPNFQNLVRMEINIKNSEAKKELVRKGIIPENLPFETVEDLFNLPQEYRIKIVHYQLSKYGQKPHKLQINNEMKDSNVPDQMIKIFIIDKIKSGSADVDILNFLMKQEYPNKYTKTRVKQKFLALLQEIKLDSAINQKSELNNEVFLKMCEIFGWK